MPVLPLAGAVAAWQVCWVLGRQVVAICVVLVRSALMQVRSAVYFVAPIAGVVPPTTLLQAQVAPAEYGPLLGAVGTVYEPDVVQPLSAATALVMPTGTRPAGR